MAGKAATLPISVLLRRYFHGSSPKSVRALRRLRRHLRIRKGDTWPRSSNL